MSEPRSFHLTAAQRRALAGLARVACPPDVDELGLADAIVDHVELSLTALPALFRQGLLAGLATYENGARALHRGRPASALDGDAALAWFQRWRRSSLLPMREWVKGAKGLLCMAYYEMPAAKQKIGYTPDAWIEKVKRKRLAVWGDEIRKQEQALIEPDPLPLDKLFGPVSGKGMGMGKGTLKEAS